MYDEFESDYRNSGSTRDGCHESVDGSDRQNSERLVSVTDDRFGRDRREFRAFLVACHQAAVSIETMSGQFGFDKETIRSELIQGLETWKAAQHRPREAMPVNDIRYLGRRNPQ